MRKEKTLPLTSNRSEFFKSNRRIKEKPYAVETISSVVGLVLPVAEVIFDLLQWLKPIIETCPFSSLVFNLFFKILLPMVLNLTPNFVRFIDQQEKVSELKLKDITELTCNVINTFFSVICFAFFMKYDFDGDEKSLGIETGQRIMLLMGAALCTLSIILKTSMFDNEQNTLSYRS